MGLILQFQRRAIEAVFEDCSLKISEGQRRYLDGEELSLLGVSVGVGTCSDLHDVDIAVFGKKAAFDLRANHPVSLPKECRGAVLLRSRLEGEVDPECPVGPGQYAFVVEGLRITPRQGRAVHFTRNFKKRTYIVLA
ncbi:MAG: hypothetical protein Q7S09_04840 [bacterium]|nr:hypothetical protein [bacterium]